MLSASRQAWCRLLLGDRLMHVSRDVRLLVALCLSPLGSSLDFATKGGKHNEGGGQNSTLKIAARGYMGGFIPQLPCHAFKSPYRKAGKRKVVARDQDSQASQQLWGSYT